MSSTDETADADVTHWIQSDTVPVLISSDLNEGGEVYATWGYVDYGGPIEGGSWMVLTKDESKAFTCSDCGCLCHHPLDSHDEQGVSMTERSLDYYEEHGVEFHTTDKETICRDCCESQPSEYGGVKYLYDEDTTLLLERFKTPPKDIAAALGSVQIEVLRALATEAEFSPSEKPFFADYGWVDRVAVTRRVAEKRPPSTANSCYASVSRAVHSLIDRGLVEGAYRSWRIYYGDSPPEHTETDVGEWMDGYQGPTPEIEDRNDNNRPTLQKVRLRNPAKYVVAHSFCNRQPGV